jgi:hypothetical protein
MYDIIEFQDKKISVILQVTVTEIVPNIQNHEWNKNCFKNSKILSGHGLL